MAGEVYFQSENLDVLWHPERGIVHSMYKNMLTAEVSALMYEKSAEIMEREGLKAVRGFVVDFTRVTAFHQSNLRGTKRESQEINRSYDLSQIPAALWVETYTQEQFVRVSVQITGTSARVKLVHSFDEALAFIEDFRRQFERVED